MPQDHQPVSFRRRQFVNAAITVINREGVAKATTRKIAEAAQLPTASLHYCFATKEDLFQAVYETVTATGFTEVGVDVKQKVGLHQGLADITRSFMKWTRGSRDMQLAVYELMMWSLRSAESQNLAARAYRRYVDGCAQFLREVRTEDELDVDIETLSRLLVGVLDGLVLQALSFNDFEDGTMTDKSVGMLQSTLTALKFEAGVAR